MNNSSAITHNFVYNNHYYPFDFNILSLSSGYFSKKQGIRNKKNIDIISDEEKAITLTEDSIQTFIKACQNELYTITRANVVAINYLSKIYEVQPLITVTNNYISKEDDDFLMQFLIKIQNEDDINIKMDENYISSNIAYYVNDDLFLLIPVFSMYRIIEKCSDKNLHELIEFLFEYLNVHGKKASILFSIIDFGAEQSKYLKRLMNEYSDKFDFAFINHKIVRELIEKEEIIQKQQQKYNESINSIKRIVFLAFIAIFLLEIKLFNIQYNIAKQSSNKLLVNEEMMKNMQNKINNIETVIDDLNSKISVNETAIKYIKLLYVRSNMVESINLNFINELNHDKNNQKYFIQYATIYGANIPINYFNEFDVIVIGGADSYAALQDSLSENDIKNLKKFHNLNGIIIFLHDVLFSKLLKSLSLFGKFLGYKRQKPTADYFTEVHFNEKCGKNNLLSTPFLIPRNFKVAPTHLTPEYDQNYSVFLNPSNENYYSENLDELFADCTMGHLPSITREEQKLFYNVICHLYQHSLNHHVQTNI